MRQLSNVGWTIPSRKKEYAIFLKSEFWKELSERVKRERGNKCERCGSKSSLQAHHKQYPKNWFETVLEDLEVLCRRCHRKEHGILSFRESNRACLRYNGEDEGLAAERLTEMISKLYHWRDFTKADKKFLRRALTKFDNGGVRFRVRKALRDWTWCLHHPEARIHLRTEP